MQDMEVGAEISLRDLARSVEMFCALQSETFQGTAQRFNAVVSGMHAMCAHLDSLDQQCVEPAHLRDALAPAVRLHATSPFVQRLQTWPRGYPGDFETVEYIVRAKNRATPGTIGFAIEQYALNAAPACQHRNKIAIQARRVQEVCLTRSRPRILALGVGGGADLETCLPELVASGADVVLNDSDADALALCTARLSPLGTGVRALTGNALALTGRLTANGPYDLIIAGGLFDYVSNAPLRRLLRALLRMLRPGSGRLFFTNMARDNPFRSWMHHFANWSLIERTEAEVTDLCQGAGPWAAVSTSRDLTNLAILVDVQTTGGQ